MAGRSEFDVYVKGTGPEAKQLGDCEFNKCFIQLQMYILNVDMYVAVWYVDLASENDRRGVC
jgi:hypothetical protein